MQRMQDRYGARYGRRISILPFGIVQMAASRLTSDHSIDRNSPGRTKMSAKSSSTAFVSGPLAYSSIARSNAP